MWMYKINKWLIADNPKCNMNDDKIVQSVLHNFNNKPSLKEIEGLEKKKSHLLLLIRHYKQVKVF